MAFPASNHNDVLKAYGIQLGQVPRPRAPPMFFRAPSPLVMERPQPLVSDVSLIMDSASTSMVSTTESLPDNMGNSISNNEAVPSQRKSVPSNDVSQNSNFGKYFPTPSLNQSSQSHSPNASHSCSKDDSGKGTSVLSPSMPSKAPRDNDDATVASDDLDEDRNERDVNSSMNRSQTEDFRILKSDVTSILKLISQQQETMNKLSSQMATVLGSQEKILDYISKFPNTLKETLSHAIEKEKTGRSIPEEMKRSGSASSVKSKSESGKTGSSKSPTTLGGGERLKKQDVRKAEKTVPSSSSLGEKNIEDFSTLLKHLEIQDVQGPSIYSQASIKPNDCFQLNDESFQENGDSRTDSPNIGPSASAYGSSSDDEDLWEAPPPPTTVTHYKNLLTTVDRLLDGKDTRGSPGCNKEHVPSATKTVQTFLPKMAVDMSGGHPCSRASTASYSNSSSSGSGVNKENIFRRENQAQAPTRPTSQDLPRVPHTNVVDATKRYLQSIGAGFDSPTPPAAENANERAKNHQQNYMIQQNVYNSIYIPTVNCVPVIPESLNSNSGFVENLAHKYISPSDLNQYEAVTNKNGGMTDTTVYGMTSSNLSFATKQYLQRYGLVGSAPEQPAPKQQALPSTGDNYAPVPITPAFKNDRILDITAIRNQPKLL